VPLAFDNANPNAHPGVLVAMFVGRTVADVERHLILDTLDYCKGNRTHSAKILGISIRTLRNKLNEYIEAGILVPEPGQNRA
jgi:two-component system response regulator FlrC